jgi:hypothetical protein
MFFFFRLGFGYLAIIVIITIIIAAGAPKQLISWAPDPILGNQEFIISID